MDVRWFVSCRCCVVSCHIMWIDPYWYGIFGHCYHSSCLCKKLVKWSHNGEVVSYCSNVSTITYLTYIGQISGSNRKIYRQNFSLVPTGAIIYKRGFYSKQPVDFGKMNHNTKTMSIQIFSEIFLVRILKKYRQGLILIHNSPYLLRLLLMC